MRKVLIIANRFPPIASSGSFRPAKFVKYLSQFGWQAYVISTDRSQGEGFDETLLRDIPSDVRVFRIPTPQPRPIDRLNKWLDGEHRTSNRSLSPQNPPQTTRRVSRLGVLRKAVLAPLRAIQYPPIDGEIYWALRVLLPARRLVLSEDIDLILTTSPPWSSMLSGLLLKFVTGRPWVADLRDPWTTDKARYGVTGWRHKIDRFLEPLLLRQADGIVAVTKDWMEDLRDRVGPNDGKNRLYLITNGYDEADFHTKPEHAPANGSIIDLWHIGSLYQGALTPLLAALNRLDERNQAMLRFHLVGYLHPQDIQRLETSPVREMFVHREKRLSHPDALLRMHDARILLLLNAYDCYPGKLFEYMRSGRPVLAITPPGLAADLVVRSGVGRVVFREDPERLTSILAEIAEDYEAFVRGAHTPRWEVIKQFERRHLAGMLGEVLSETLRPS